MSWTETWERVDPAAIETLATILRLGSERLRETSSLASAAVVRGWRGHGSVAASAICRSCAWEADRAHEALWAAAVVLRGLAAALVEGRQMRSAAMRYAEENGLTPTSEGQLRDLRHTRPPGAPRDLQHSRPPPSPVLVDARTETAAWSPRLAAVAAAEVDAADRRAAAELARLAVPVTIRPLDGAARAQAAYAADTAAPPQPPMLPPPAAAAWCSGLTPGQLSRLLIERPSLLGELDGAPVGLRDTANRAVLGRVRVADAAEQAGLQRRLAAKWQEPWLHRLAPGWRSDVTRLSARLRRILGRRRGCDLLAAELGRPGRMLLAFDPAGDGRAAVVLGDVRRARHVAVLVPGMDVEIDDANGLLQSAHALSAVAPATTVVAWLGYDTPRLLEALGDGRARRGARELARFVRGVRATAEERQRVTVIGHSYGSLVTGLAAREGLGADDVVLLGSPGVEARTAGELRVPSGHVWVARAPDDPVRLVFSGPDHVAHLLGVVDGHHQLRWFGPDPSDPAFGARRFRLGSLVHGHSSYFAPNSDCLVNLGRIVSGHSTQVTR